jgi:hypothetical protein
MDQQRFHDVYLQCEEQFNTALERRESPKAFFEGECVENATPEQRKVVSAYLLRNSFWYAREIGF